jgi:hypothetical protein
MAADPIGDMANVPPDSARRVAKNRSIARMASVKKGMRILQLLCREGAALPRADLRPAPPTLPSPARGRRYFGNGEK